MGTSVEIRKYKPRYLKDCTRLFVDAFSREPWNDNWTFPRAKNLLRDITNMPGFKGLVIRVDKEIIGACLGRITCIADEDVYHVEYMFVDPRCQRKGYGQRLLSQVKDVLVQSGVRKIGLTTFIDTPAESFYKQAGFRTSGRVVNMYTEVENLHP